MTSRMLDMRQLRHILELDRYKNFRRAAESLCISQPALTKSIQHLESMLGVTLFDRHAGVIAPTPSCEVILEHAHRVFVELDEMNHRLDSLEQQRGGELKIGTGPIMAESVLPEPLSMLVEELPDVRIEVIVDDWSNLPRLVRQGDLHLFVVDIARLQDEADLEVISLGKVENILVCRPEHPLAADKRVTPSDFLEFPLALPRMSERLRVWLTEHAPSDMSPQAYYAAIHRIQCRNIPLLRNLVSRANYITGGPRKLFELELAAGALVELRMDQCDVLYCEPSISYLKGRTLPPVAHRFIDILRSRERGPRKVESDTRSRRSASPLESFHQQAT